MDRFYYLIKKEDLVYNMVRYSMMSMDTSDSPSSNEIFEFKKKIRMVIDTTDNNQGHYIVKMGIDFSTPTVGLIACTAAQIKTILKEVRWEHNRIIEIEGA